MNHNRIIKPLSFFGILTALILSCSFYVFASDIIIRTVNVGMSAVDSGTGAIAEAYPVCYATDTYDPYFAETSSYAIDTSATTFSRSFDNWKAGDPVKVHVVLKPKSGYRFDSQSTVINVIGNNVKLDKKTISANQIKVSLAYWPTIVLPCIDADSVRTDENNEYILIWDPVQVSGSNWKSYQVRVMSDDAGSKSVITKDVSTNKVDLSDMVMGGSYTIAIRTIGGSAGKERYTKNSEWTVLSDEYNEVSASVSGTFSGTGDKMVYLDKSGNMISGWVNINNCWYYFDPDNKNRAVTDKFKEIDGKWYYFQSNGVMKLGWVDYNDHKYYMHPENDGNAGAMETGWVATGPSGPYYFFNDGSITDLPLGALFTDGVTPDGYTVDANGKWCK